MCMQTVFTLSIVINRVEHIRSIVIIFTKHKCMPMRNSRMGEWGGGAILKNASDTDQKKTTLKAPIKRKKAAKKPSHRGKDPWWKKKVAKMPQLLI